MRFKLEQLSCSQPELNLTMRGIHDLAQGRHRLLKGNIARVDVPERVDMCLHEASLCQSAPVNLKRAAGPTGSVRDCTLQTKRV